MGMKEYAINDYGFILDKEVIELIASKAFDDFSNDDNTLPDWVDLGYELYEKGICEYVSEFTGELQELTDTGEWNGNSKYCNCETIFYVPLSKYPALFKAAYKSMKEAVNELRSKLSNYLPATFDYRSRVCYIGGTYYG